MRSDKLLLKHISLLKLLLLLKTLLVGLLLLGPDWSFLMALLFEESTFVAHFRALSQQTLHSGKASPRSLVNFCLLCLIVLLIFGIHLIYGCNARAMLQHLMSLMKNVLWGLWVAVYSVVVLMRLHLWLGVVGVLGIRGVLGCKFSLLIADALRVRSSGWSCIRICHRHIIGSFVGPECHFFARSRALHSEVKFWVFNCKLQILVGLQKRETTNILEW